MKTIEAVEKYLLSAIIVAFAVFAVSVTTAPLVIPKLALISFGVCIAILLLVIKSMLKRELSFNIGKFDIAVLLLMLSYLLSAIFKSGNKMEAFAFPGVATFVIASCLFYFLMNQFKKSGKETFSVALIISGVLLSIVLLFTQIQIFAKIPQLPAFVKDANFNPTGGAIPSLIYLAVLLPLAVKFVTFKSDFAEKLFYGVSSAIILAGLAVSITNILPGKPQTPRFPPLQTSWEVAVEAIKQSPLLGVGSGDYLTAFNRFRPITYNQTDLWPIKFATASNYYLTAVTELGLLGALALIVLLYITYRFVSAGRFNFEKGLVLLPLILFALYPASPVILFIFFTVLALSSHSEEKNVVLLKGSSPVVVALATVPFFAGIFAFTYIGINTLKAEQYYKEALEALSKNDAQKTYDSMIKAVNSTPTVDRYHASFAQINMVLASSIAQKQTISDEERNTISQLIQAAIAQGKATVSLNQLRSGNWEVLAGIYRAIMPFAQGADNFALQTYSQAIALDPINPNLRIALGGTYFALGRYDEAIETFKLAVLAKPDFANAHYNLSAAYREKGDIEKAIEEMNAVLSLVEKDSPEYQTASSELAALEGKRTPKAEESENLTEPEPIEESNITPPIELPQEATPPEGQ